MTLDEPKRERPATTPVGAGTATGRAAHVYRDLIVVR